MTVPSELYKVEYAGDGITKIFSIPFQFSSNEDIRVALRASFGDVIDLSAGFTITGAGTDDGQCEVASPPLSGQTLVIGHSPAGTQDIDYISNDPFPAASHEGALDRAIRVSHRLIERSDRALRLPFGDPVTGTDMRLPPKSQRLGKYLRFSDVSGAPELALFDGSGTPISQSIIGALLQPQIPAETSAGVIANTIFPALPYDLRRAGLVPNSAAARASNTAALKALLNPDSDGPKGWLVLPNTTGADTYYFDMDDVPIRPGTALDLQGCTLDVGGAYSSGNDTHAFLECIRDVLIENGAIVVDYDGSAGVNNGNAIRIGARPGYAFGAFLGEEEDLAEPMGRVTLRDLKVTSNNPSGAPILMLGGLDSVLLENVAVDGAGTASKGILYEFGLWHMEATVANRKTSHATNLQLRNVSIRNVENTAGVSLTVTGAMSLSVDGLHIEGGFTPISFRPGEALYYNMGPAWAGSRAHYGLRNVVVANVAGTSLFRGAESKSGGYLSGEAGVTEAKQCDLISFSMDGFSHHRGITINGRHVRLANGVQYGGGNSGGILMQDELRQFEFDNISVLDNGGIGIRSQTGTNIFSVARLKQGSIRNSFVAGNGITSNEAGIALGNSDGVLIEACTFGYSEAKDGVAEATQGSGVSNTSTARNTTVRNCHGAGITSTGSPAMYANAGAGGWKNAKLESVSGISTTSNRWTRNGDGVDVDVGDADVTLVVGTNLPTQRYATTLTGNRTVTLSSTGAYNGAKFRIVRTGLGSFTLDVGGLKTIASATAAYVDVVYDGSAWRLAGYGAL